MTGPLLNVDEHLDEPGLIIRYRNISACIPVSDSAGGWPQGISLQTSAAWSSRMRRTSSIV